MAAPDNDMALLYQPQFEQLGIDLAAGGGAGRLCPVRHDQVVGSAWVVPVCPTCLVLEHSITPLVDLSLTEVTPLEYACVAELSAPSVDLLPVDGFASASVAARRDPWPHHQVRSFRQDRPGEYQSPLVAGHLYRSRSILFSRRHFEELERSYPGQFAGMFDAFAGEWDEEAARAIRGALRQLDARHACAPAASLHARGVVETMLCALSLSRTERTRAELVAGTHGSARIALDAAQLARRLLDDGHQATIDELAGLLYVSRSRLCATFRAETGEPLGAWLRRQRAERACELLADASLTVAEVSRLLGYPRPSAFSQAFRQATGLSPTAWRAGRR